jgi:CRISPR-associated protein Cmr6
MKYYLPRDLREVLKDVKIVDNLSLQVSKIVPFFPEKDIDKPKLKDFVEKVLERKNLRITTSVNDYRWFFENVKLLWESVNAEVISMKTASRLVVGLGDESVYETSIRLHRNYGVPYIPGSALKGVAKHWTILKIAEKLDASVGKIQEWLEGNEEKDVSIYVGTTEITFDEIRKIFGTQEFEGNIVFFDAFPNPDEIALELDVMNPHYQPYYTTGEAPGDWYQPTPIFFLTVPKGVKFEFAIMSRDDEDLIKKAKSLLVEALKEFGVGAKTSLGYGRFKEP